MANEMIAVVDDEVSLRMAVSRLLGAYSYRVETYAGGQEFIDSLHDNAPECLVLDLNMEPMNGVEVLQYLAKTRNPIPTIVLTARDSPEIRERCRQAGAIAFLVKPATADKLVRAIQVALNEKLTS